MDLESLSIRDALDAIAARQPTPGGGAVASLTAALAGALAQMVVNYSIGGKRYVEHEHAHGAALNDLQSGVQRAIELADEDARAYEQLNQLFKLDKDDPRRQSEWSGAVHAAIAAPSAVLQCAIDLLQRLVVLAETTNRMLYSDLVIAAILAEAAARSALCSIKVNLPLLDESQTAGIRENAEASVAQARELAARLEA